ncbi:MAG: aminotransferase class V-fold PLP-dependent enzyme [Acidobacteria bacterium]|nr:aminotransferase class V-fold PLP-dependent enzyme [Acidobacteriota bacterium]
MPNWAPEVKMLERRTFLQAIGAAAALAGLVPGRELAAWEAAAPGLIERLVCAKDPPLPSEELFRRRPESYWAELRRQFVFRPGFLYLNNGTVGSCPLPVLRAFIESILHEEQMENEDTEQYPLWGYGLWDQYRRPMAEFIGARMEELALVRNATEGLNYVANGLDLRAGDEVLTTDEEHPSGLNPWLLKQKRYGIGVKQVTLPKPPQSKEQILNLLEEGCTERTRVVMVSHVTTTTGLVMPVREICAWARERGLLTLVDGAHAVGMLGVNVKEVGCDFYVSSPHKWLLAPKGCGLLYVRDEVCDLLWTTIATGEWDNRDIRAGRLQQFGSTNASILAGLVAAIRFWQALGPERIERRIRQLHAYLKERVARLPGAELHSAAGEEFTGGILAVNFPGLERMKLQQRLYEKHRIRIRGTSPTRLRLSTHIYHSFAELDRFVDALDDYLQTPAV